MADPGNPPAGDTVEKLMSITRQEFEMSLARLYGMPALLVAPGRYELAGAGLPAPVYVDFEELPKAVLGGLMALPRARVSLNLGAMHGPERAAFVRLFDKTFQRGGG